MLIRYQTIGLDYDGTITADIELWLLFIRAARANGHTVHVVTMRYPTEDALDMRILQLVGLENIIFTSRKAKVEYVKAMSINIDIWIDDNPTWLFQDSR